jgi:hypothetical protein
MRLPSATKNHDTEPRFRAAAESTVRFLGRFRLLSARFTAKCRFCVTASLADLEVIPRNPGNIDTNFQIPFEMLHCGNTTFKSHVKCCIVATLPQK